MEDGILKFSLGKGFGEMFWNLCPVCGNASVRTTFWEDKTVEHEECATCERMIEIMDLEDLFARRTAGD